MSIKNHPITTTTTTTTTTTNQTLWTWSDIKHAIEQQNRIIFIFNYNVYDVTDWANHHPGGRLALHHMNGKDATDVITVFHPPVVVKHKLPRFKIGTLSTCATQNMYTPPRILDTYIYPTQQTYTDSPIQPIMNHPDRAPVTHSVHTVNHPKAIPLESKAFILHTEHVVQEYRLLDKTIRDLGLYKTDMHLYYNNFVRFILMLSAVTYTIINYIHPLLLLTNGHSVHVWVVAMITAIVLGLFWHQIAFVAHDAGHISITGTYSKDWYIGWMLGNVLGGISIGWWKKSHNVHHIKTNHLEHDPDVQHLPVFAISSTFFANLKSSFHQRILQFGWVSKYLVPYQHLTFYPIMMVARFNLYAQSFIYLITDTDTNKHQRTELIGLCLFWIWFTYLLSYLILNIPLLVSFILVSHAVTFLLHLQITLSHFAMSVHEISDVESFPSRQLRTTMDVDCPEWLDWFHGGLQFQAIHHLFPKLPRTSFRKARPLVCAFAQRVHLEYHRIPFVQGNTMLIRHFAEVGRQFRILFQQVPGAAKPVKS